MPGIGGLATLARLREMSQLVPVIILSGSGTDADFAAARKYGVADWLQKPFDPGELLRSACPSDPGDTAIQSTLGSSIFGEPNPSICLDSRPPPK